MRPPRCPTQHPALMSCSHVPHCVPPLPPLPFLDQIKNYALKYSIGLATVVITLGTYVTRTRAYTVSARRVGLDNVVQGIMTLVPKLPTSPVPRPSQLSAAATGLPTSWRRPRTTRGRGLSCGCAGLLCCALLKQPTFVLEWGLEDGPPVPTNQQHDAPLPTGRCAMASKRRTAPPVSNGGGGHGPPDGSDSGDEVRAEGVHSSKLYHSVLSMFRISTVYWMCKL